MTLLYFVIRENAFDITQQNALVPQILGDIAPRPSPGTLRRWVVGQPQTPASPPPSMNFCIGHGQSMTVFVGDYLLSVYNDDPTPRLPQ